METVTLGDGRQATYEVIGHGSPALMLPGGPGFASRYMRGTAELLADFLQIYLVDPHGSGGSTPPKQQNDYSPEGHARFYEEVRAALGLSQMAVIGHSFGATTALTYAALYPGSVDRCVAVAPYGLNSEIDTTRGGDVASEQEAMLGRHAGAAWYEEARFSWDSWSDRVHDADNADEVERVMIAVSPLYTAYPERAEVAAGLDRFAKDLRINLAALKAWEEGLYQQTDLRPLLGRIATPTLVIAGELDLICGPAQAVPISGAIAHAKLVLLPDCGHFPSFETTEQLRTEIITWMDTTP